MSSFISKCLDKENCVWTFNGANSGDIEFVPYLPPANKAELTLSFNTTTSNGNILCTKDDTLAFNVELVDSNLIVNVREIRNKRVLQTLKCMSKSGEQFNDNSLHKIKLIKKGVNQVKLI